MRNTNNIALLLATALSALLAKSNDATSLEARQAQKALEAHREYEADQAKSESDLRALLVNAERFIRDCAKSPMSEVPALLAQLREAIAKLDFQPFAVDRLRDLIEASEEVVANWERGDLAGAVNNLEGWAETAKSELEDLSRHPKMPVVVVEIDGGNCSDVSASGGVRVLVVDYDNGEGDDSAPEIPDRDGATASVADHRGPWTSEPGFIAGVCAIADAEQSCQQAA